MLYGRGEETKSQNESLFLEEGSFLASAAGEQFTTWYFCSPNGHVELQLLFYSEISSQNKVFRTWSWNSTEVLEGLHASTPIRATPFLFRLGLVEKEPRF